MIQVFYNPDKNGIEIHFDGAQPKRETDVLYAGEYKYHRKERYWWSVAGRKALETFIGLRYDKYKVPIALAKVMVKRFVNLLGKPTSYDDAQDLFEHIIALTYNASHPDWEKPLAEIESMLNHLKELIDRNEFTPVKPIMSDKRLEQELRAIAGKNLLISFNDIKDHLVTRSGKRR